LVFFFDFIELTLLCCLKLIRILLIDNCPESRFGGYLKQYFQAFAPENAAYRSSPKRDFEQVLSFSFVVKPC